MFKSFAVQPLTSWIKLFCVHIFQDFILNRHYMLCLEYSKYFMYYTEEQQ